MPYDCLSPPVDFKVEIIKEFETQTLKELYRGKLHIETKPKV